MSRSCPEVFGRPQALQSTKPDDMKVVKSEERGLSDFVKQCLGRPLNKCEQMSDWERRPLRQAQVIYAALDAFTLVEVYQFIKDKVTELDLDLDLEPGFHGSKGAHPHQSKAQRRQEQVAERPHGKPRVN